MYADATFGYDAPGLGWLPLVGRWRPTDDDVADALALGESVNTRAIDGVLAESSAGVQ